MTAEETKPTQTATQQNAAQPAAPVVEKQTNCLSCNKPINKLKRYYRDGKFYCNKICWRNFKNKQKEEKK
jgi:hypothetical protein